MPRTWPLELKSTIGSSYSVDPDDVMVTKRSLQRLNLYEPPDWGLTGFTDFEMFDGIKTLQENDGLLVDGLMHPRGETAKAIGSRLADKTPVVHFSSVAGSDRNRPSEVECDHLYWNIDIPTCRAIMARRGKRAAARCFHTATARYAACLHGTPINALPPLDTWNQ